MEGDTKRPHNLRTILLAIPKRVTKKFVPPVYIPGTVDTGVKPGAIKGGPVENWRINQLSEANQRKKTEKYVFVPEEAVGTGISASTLAGHGTDRTDHLSRPVMRYVVNNKKAFRFLGNPFLKNMDKTIKSSWNSIYNYYKKSLIDLQKKRKARKLSSKKSKASETSKGKSGKGGKDKGKPASKPKTQQEIQEEKEKKIIERCAVLAIPKPVPPPSPLPPRKIADMSAIQERMNQIAEPKGVITKKYRRPSIDSTYVDPFKISESARTYQISERILEIAKCPPHRLVKEPIYRPGAVKRAALQYKITPAIAEMAIPKKKAAERDNEFKDNPFAISPNALKYVATARMQELAKPVER